MRRADRLYRITDYLRSRRLTTAEWLAQRVGVSVRTIYRDIADLVSAGVPIHGEAGVGYALARRMDLPPLMFDRGELAALALGLRFVIAHADDAVQAAAERARGKILGVLPREEAERMQDVKAFVPRGSAPAAARLADILAAVDRQEVLRIAYADERGSKTQRDVRPLGVLFGVAAWSMIAWCELRQAHRTFRLDRIRELHATGRTFAPEPGRGLQEYFDQMWMDYGIPTQHFDPAR